MSPPVPTPSGERFPPWVRLRRRREFQRVFDGGRRCARRFLVLVTSPAEDPRQATRLGLTVSRKVGNAVARNRVKRHLRDIFRRLHGDLPAGHDLVLIARPGAADATHAQLREDFLKCLTKLELLTPAPRPTQPSLPAPEPSADS